MHNPKVLITGANGQLGREITQMLKSMESPLGPLSEIWRYAEIVTSDISGDVTRKLNIADEAAVYAELERHKYNYIINCAAATNVDGCESDPELAHKLNTLAPRILAKGAEQTGATLMHVSTDYVLGGKEPMPQAEDALCSPDTVYGKTKLEGEEEIKKHCSKYFIARTAWLYGTEGNNFVRTMLKLAKDHTEIKVVDDQYGSPTFAGDLAHEMLALLETTNYGLYHVTNNGATTWADFARTIFDINGLRCKVFGCSTKEWNAPAPRPAYSILDNKHLRDTIGDKMRSWDVALQGFLK